MFMIELRRRELTHTSYSHRATGTLSWALPEKTILTILMIDGNSRQVAGLVENLASRFPSPSQI